MATSAFRAAMQASQPGQQASRGVSGAGRRSSGPRHARRAVHAASERRGSSLETLDAAEAAPTPQLQGMATAAGAAAAAAAAAPAPMRVEAPIGPGKSLVYAGVIFDMDGTLTVSNIDYVTMRKETGIPVGDLFTAMESWDDGGRIKSAMDVILGLEALASSTLEHMPGLPELLAFLRDCDVKVGLVTRNTTESLNAFFSLIGEEWREVFDIMLTREFKHVKPDPRSLTHFAEQWGLEPHQLLMVGDSLEDIETGNAAGTATSLIAGGGNETLEPGEAAAPPPPPGAVPTFVVASLYELQQRLASRDTALGWGAYQRPSGYVSSGSDSDSEGGGEFGLAGAPPPGLDFLDALFARGALNAATCSFPRIDGSRFGVPSDAHPGDRVLHLACGRGSLTKLLFASGLQVVGADVNVASVQRRGLPAVQLQSLSLAPGTLPAELREQLFDAIVYWGPYGATLEEEEESAAGGASLAAGWWRKSALREAARVLAPGGRLCIEADVLDPGAVFQQLRAAGFKAEVWEDMGAPASGHGGMRVRLVAAEDSPDFV